MLMGLGILRQGGAHSWEQLLLLLIKKMCPWKWVFQPSHTVPGDASGDPLSLAPITDS